MNALPHPLILVLAALLLLLGAAALGNNDKYDTEQCIYEAQMDNRDVSTCR